MGHDAHADTRTQLDVVCPTCDNLMAAEVQADDHLAPGGTIELFCSTCERPVKVTIPDGIQAHAEASLADALKRPATEFAPTPTGRAN